MFENVKNNVEEWKRLAGLANDNPSSLELLKELDSHLKDPINFLQSPDMFILNSG